MLNFAIMRAKKENFLIFFGIERNQGLFNDSHSSKITTIDLDFIPLKIRTFPDQQKLPPIQQEFLPFCLFLELLVGPWDGL